mgnify:FL=1
MTRTVNVVSVVGVASDVVTLPSVYAGAVCIVANRGANNLQIFPASGDDINEQAVNTSYTIAANAETMFIGTSTSEWITIA